MRSIIISAFPGMGKTYARSFEKFRIKDLDSSQYRWIEDASKGRLPNPDFPNNYIEAIDKEQNSGKYDFIFVSSHSEIRDHLNKNKIQYILISPKENLRDSLCKRYKDRGNSERFIKQMHDNWYNYTGSILNETYPFQIKFGEKDFITEDLLEILRDSFEEILSKTLNYTNSKNLPDGLGKYNVFWSTLSKNRKGWTSKEIRQYKDFIDWDVLCKFNVLPEDIIKDGKFSTYINYKYLSENKKKYNPKIRRLIK